MIVYGILGSIVTLGQILVVWRVNVMIGLSDLFFTSCLSGFQYFFSAITDMPVTIVVSIKSVY